jgi:hypothetical protein
MTAGRNDDRRITDVPGRHLEHVYLMLDIHSRVDLTVLALRYRIRVG